MIFCDTSAAAKFYLPEKESAAIRRLLEGDDEVCLSELARVELPAVFHRYLREGKWTHTEFLSVNQQFSNDDVRGFWTWLPLDKSVLQAAASLYSTLPASAFLRSSDCIHLTTALRNGFEVVHTYDAHQSKAAPALGLKTAVA